MKIVIRSDKTNISMPVPMNMAAFAIKKIPDSVLERFRAKLPAEYANALCKENLIFIFETCRPELEKYKGLEVINARKEDGTFVLVIL